MKLFKKKSFWFILYGVCITTIFLYVLFPAETVRSKLESSVNSSDFIFRSSSLRVSFPFGLKFKNVTLRSSSFGQNPVFHGESLDIQYSLLNLIRKRLILGLSGQAYGGSFNGSSAVLSWKKIFPPAEAKLYFKNIDLQKFGLLKNKVGGEISGKAHGFLNYETDDAGGITEGALQVFISDGAYPLAEPFLGINKIDFTTAHIEAVFQSEGIGLKLLELSGERINCSLAGDIIPDADLAESRLDLKGTIEIIGKDRTKVQVAIGGTLANPVFKYI